MTVATAISGKSDLAALLQKYNEVTERLKRSHDVLTREVCRLREELQEKNKELERRERLAALGEMAAGVAHEIRNPLSGIGLYASLLARDLADRPSELETVRKISAALWSLDSVVRDILAFAGDSQPVRQSVPLGEILENVLERVRPKAEELRTTVHVDSSLRVCVLDCDPGQMERAIANLVFNALDAAGPDGEVCIRRSETAIWRPVHTPTGFVRIAVEDSGPGIPQELLHRIFDPFFTTKHSGTGLGLAIVHRTAESHGGWITAGNRPDGGASFVLSIPLASEFRIQSSPHPAAGRRR